MQNVLTLIKKEIKDYFISPIAYVVIAAFLAAVGIWFAFVKELYVLGQAQMRQTFIFITQILAIVVPALTMRSWAEEKKSGTIEILSTLPVSKLELIVAKFVSTFTFVLIAVFLTLPIPITLNILGSPDNGVIVAGYIGLTLLSASYVMIGQFVSINTRNQIVSFILGMVIIAILYILGELTFLQLLPSSVRPVFEALGIGSHFRSIARGVIDTRDVFYYLSIVIVLFYFIYKSLSRLKKEGR